MKLHNELGLAQESLSIAMARGNINQVGHDGWSTLIDIIQRVIGDQVTEWRNEDLDPEYKRQKAEYDEMVKNRLRQKGQKQDNYDQNLKQQQEWLSQNWVLHDDFSYFYEQKCTEDIYTPKCVIISGI